MSRLVVLALLLTACGDNLTPAPEREQLTGHAPAPLPCTPNLDARIDFGELPTVLGATLSYLVSRDGEQRNVDVTGVINDAGQRVWDWSLDAPTDETATLGPRALAGRWYEASFPDGQFVAPMDVGAHLEMVFRRDEQAIWLLGYASTQQDPPEGRTLLVYNQPAALYRFPLEPGRQWTSSAEIRNGLNRNLPYAADDSYRVEVVNVGRLLLPDLTFTQAMQLRIEATVDPAVGATTSVRQVSFVSECFGEVARATSRPNEPAAAFTAAEEVRRLGM